MNQARYGRWFPLAAKDGERVTIAASGASAAATWTGGSLVAAGAAASWGALVRKVLVGYTTDRDVYVTAGVMAAGTVVLAIGGLVLWLSDHTKVESRPVAMRSPAWRIIPAAEMAPAVPVLFEVRF